MSVLARLAIARRNELARLRGLDAVARRRDLVMRLIAITDRLEAGHERSIGLAMNGARLKAMERAIADLADEVMAAELDRLYPQPETVA